MSTEHASIGASIAMGAGMAALWFVLFLIVFFGDLSPRGSVLVNVAAMALSFAAVVILVPGMIDDKYKNVKSGFFLCLGAVLVVIPMLAGLGAYLLSGPPLMTSHQ